MNSDQQQKEPPLLLLPTTEEFYRVPIHHKLSVIASLAGRLKINDQRDKSGEATFGENGGHRDKKLSEYCRMISVSPAFNVVARSARKKTLEDIMRDEAVVSTLQNWDNRRRSDMDFVAYRICFYNLAAWNRMTRIPYSIPTIEFESLENSFGRLSRGIGPRKAIMTLNPDVVLTKDPAQYCNTVLHEDLHARGVDLADTYDYYPNINLGAFKGDAEMFSALYKTKAILPSKLGQAYRAQFHERVSFRNGAAFGADIRRALKAEKINLGLYERDFL